MLPVGRLALEETRGLMAAPVNEFDLIRRFLQGTTAQRDDVVLGIGDDCALLRATPGELLAVSMDTLVEGRHFFPGCDPQALGHKALAVNLSDLAAMGARPAWATLSLTMPSADTQWLSAFVSGFAALARLHELQLVGGDMTRGPLSVTVQVHGWVDEGSALRRSGGAPGDRVFVSGTIGDAALALQWLLTSSPDGQPSEFLRRRLDRPTPRINLGQLLCGCAGAAIDISDGLTADLGHICTASGCGARIELAAIPLSNDVAAYCAGGDWKPVLAGGDDYEVLFSVSPENVDELLSRCEQAGESIKEIGQLVATPGITLVYPDGGECADPPRGFDHFASNAPKRCP
jgi:thiamine-monophosphate kinase